MQEVPCALCLSRSCTLVHAGTINADARIEAAAFRCTSGEYGKHPPIVRCENCGHLYANPRWTPDEILSAYEDVEDETYVQEEEGRVRTFARRLLEMEKVIGEAQGRMLLDVGAYTGVFVKEALI